MSVSYWRQKSQHHIWKTLKENGISPTTNLSDAPDEEKQEIKCILKNAYPFGVRENHPYRIWCEERRKALETIGITPKKK